MGVSIPQKIEKEKLGELSLVMFDLLCFATCIANNMYYKQVAYIFAASFAQNQKKQVAENFHRFMLSLADKERDEKQVVSFVQVSITITASNRSNEGAA